MKQLHECVYLVPGAALYYGTVRINYTRTRYGIYGTRTRASRRGRAGKFNARDRDYKSCGLSNRLQELSCVQAAVIERIYTIRCKMGNGASQKTLANDLLRGQTNIPLRRNSKKWKREAISNVRHSFRAGVVADRHWQERAMESIG